VASESINHSIVVGLGCSTKKSYILALSKERLMLAQNKCQLDILVGVNLRFRYFCTHNFVICANNELQTMDEIDFSLHFDEYGNEDVILFYFIGFYICTFKDLCFYSFLCGVQGLGGGGGGWVSIRCLQELAF
jgi:hypothetical protein